MRTSANSKVSCTHVVLFSCRKQDRIQRAITDSALALLQRRQSLELPELRCTFLGAKNVGKTAIITSLEQSAENISRFSLRAREITADDYPPSEKLQNSDVIFIVFSCIDEHSWLVAKQLHVYLQHQQITVPVFFIGTHSAVAWNQDKVYFDLACSDMKVTLLLSCRDSTPCTLVSTLEDVFQFPPTITTPHEVVTHSHILNTTGNPFFSRMRKRIFKTRG